MEKINKRKYLIQRKINKYEEVSGYIANRPFIEYCPGDYIFPDITSTIPYTTFTNLIEEKEMWCNTFNEIINGVTKINDIETFIKIMKKVNIVSYSVAVALQQNHWMIPSDEEVIYILGKVISRLERDGITVVGYDNIKRI